MRIVAAPDSFKGSLDAVTAARAIAAGVRDALPEAAVVECPMADGGEGTVRAIVSAVGGELRTTAVPDPLGRSIEAEWGWLPATRTAVIESAAACGLSLVADDDPCATRTSSAGCGTLILAALDAGARELIFGLGGTATTDGGHGLLSVLGARFETTDGRPIAAGGQGLLRLARIDLVGLDPRLSEVVVRVANDVDNPLCGPQGAAAIFAPQKGASPDEVLDLDRGLQRLAECAAETLGEDFRDQPGCGAAGGIGFALRAFLGGRFEPGVSLVAERVGLAAAIDGAALVLTGEGRLDRQTLHGKTVLGVARLARARGVPVIALAGMLGEGFEALHALGVTAAFSIVSGPMSLESAIAQGEPLLRRAAAQAARAWAEGR